MKQAKECLLYLAQITIVALTFVFVTIANVHYEFKFAIYEEQMYIPFLMYIILYLALIVILVLRKKLSIPTAIVSFFIVSVPVCMYYLNPLSYEYKKAIRLFNLPYLVVIAFVELKVDLIDNTKKYKFSNTEIDVFDITKKAIYYSLCLCLYVGLSIFSPIIHLMYNNSLLLACFVFIFIISISLVIDIALNPIFKLHHNMNTMSYSKFKNVVDDMKSKKLHPESINYINMIYSYYTYAYDPIESYKYFDVYWEPSFKKYKYFYRYCKILFAIYKNDSEIEELILNIKLSKADRLYLEIINKALNSEENIDDIERKLFVFKGFKAISNCFILMQYYNKRGNKERAKYYSNKLLAYNSDFNYFNNKAKEIEL